ncbi:MAG: Glycine betaine/proline/choline transporter [Candidatus Scalindua arabica]|uniref:Glycine betaine/proline/choline transporter n=1 Tax=Candidatus Scalindua arabica TaxID=1127984 RepID=A0A942A5D1_9BACT|nr:Glycine betaine/proline/choline transporter [Candidatus Scalindua arabica]
MGKRKQWIQLEIHHTVFWVSAGLIIFFVAFTLINPEYMQHVFDTAQGVITQKAGWFYILSVNVFLVIVVYLLLSRYGRIRLGGEGALPEFSYLGWLSMLFSAGMGIGILFYSVAEPVIHYNNPPWGEGGSVESANLAMGVTFFHWGIHAWGLYALMALGLAYYSFNHKMPLTIRSAFYPLLGKHIHGWMGNVIDILASVSTLFGLATSLGLGAKQVNAGLNYLTGLPQTNNIQVILIAGITSMALASVVLGLDKGIRRLSQANMIFALILLIFILFVGPTVYIFDSMVQNIGTYIDLLPKLSMWTDAYHRDNSWQDGWTIFYWAWWIAWSPFVGIFIARISYGRTIREFVLNVLLVPTLLTLIWMTVFGNAALFEEMFGASGIASAVNDNIATALFVLLDRFPLAVITSALGVIVLTLFFVSSSDSASLVIDIITAGGFHNPPVIQRVFWASTEGIVAAVLLLGGGLQALQAAVIITGLPFTVVILLLGYSLIKGLRQDFPDSRNKNRNPYSKTT